MRKLIFFVASLFWILSLEARPLKSLPGFSWEVVPTNPVCDSVAWPPGTVSRSGAPLQTLPPNAWCSKGDLAKNISRPDTPEFKLLSFIRHPEVTRIRMAYLSFGNERVSKALCEALQRGVQVELILDSSKPWPVEQELKNCASGNFSYYSRGNAGGIGFAHNKVTIFNFKSASTVEMVLGSGNLTTGTILTHENWHFISAPRDSYFVSLHECLLEGMKNHAATARAYEDFIRDCKSAIVAPPEAGLQVYLIPGHGEEMLSQLQSELVNSGWVVGASHRFNGGLITGLLSEVLRQKVSVKMIFDDDIFWAGVGRKGFGLNQYSEAKAVRDLEKKGLSVRYVQTNHKEHLIHHNKFFVWGSANQVRGAFFGAGNLTDSAFTKNFENFYLVTVPEVVEDMHLYQEHLWQDLSTEASQMPQSPL